MRPVVALHVVSFGYLALLAAQLSAQPALRSDFFRDDPTASAIATGTITKDINDVGLEAAITQGDTTTFAYRVVSAYKQIGYFFPYGQTVGDRPQEMIQNRFQLAERLPVASRIDANLLLRLDALLASREASDRTKGPAFPLFPKIPAPPLNEPPATHLAAVYNAVFSALPVALTPWTEENFRLYFLIQRSGTILDLPGGGYNLCDQYYYMELGDGCTVLGPKIWVWNDDFSLGATSLHEYAHFLDGSLYDPAGGSAIGSLRTMEFYDIGYDTTDRVVDGWTFYRPRGTDIADRISRYAIGWQTANHPGYFTAYEDFAESFTAYVLQGFVFRDLARSRPLLAARYEWLKSHVFGGTEYDTGDRNYRSFFSSDDRPGNVIDYSRADPAFVWNQAVPLLGVPTPLSFFPVTPCRVVDTRGAIEPSRALAAGGTLTISAAGSCDIPSTAAAVAINVLAVEPTTSGSFTVYPGSGMPPNSSTVAFGPGKTRASMAVVGLLDGFLSVLNTQPSGSAHLVIDTSGYFQ